MEDLQSLLEKINRDGVEKAEAEAKKIVDAAKAKADALIADARAEAAKAKADAEKASADYANRAADTVRQASRDIILQIKDSVTGLLEGLLVKDVSKALADEKAASALVMSAIRELTGPGEIACRAELAKTLASELAATSGFTVVTDESQGAGFTVRLEGGRVEHSFTDKVIAAELARRLRPDLAKLIG